MTIHFTPQGTNPLPSPLRCAPNFRDLGGIPARGGQPVKHGRLFRSETLHKPCAEDLRWLGQGKIGLVVDMRTDQERAQQGGYWLSQSQVPVRHMPKRTDVRAAEGDAWQARLAEMDLATARQRLLDSYRQMPAAFSATLAQLFELLDTPDAPSLLVHCVLGKDRTGFAVAMILAALGAEREAIMQDYLATGQRLPAKEVAERKIQQLMEADKPTPSPEVLQALCSVSPDWLEAAFESAQAPHGSLNGFLDACGAGPARRARLQAHLLG